MGKIYRRPPKLSNVATTVTPAMSKEAPDTIFYEGVEYLLFESEPSPVFNLKQFGITKEKLGKPCFDGFLQIFAIRDGGLFLVSVEGVEVPGRDLRLHYTGTLRFCKELDPTYHIDVFGPSMWMFRIVNEVVIVDGDVRSVSDISAKMARIRARQPASTTVKGRFEKMRKLIANLEKRPSEPEKATLLGPVGSGVVA